MPIGAIREIKVTAKHGDGSPIEKLGAVDALPPWLELQFGEKGKITVKIRGDRMPGERDEAVSVDATNLSPGHHYGVIEFESNDRRRGRINVPVSVKVL